MTNDIDLNALPLLAGATKDETEILRGRSKVIDAAPGEQLFPAFAPTDAFWILIKGRWRVTRRVARVPQLMFEADRPGTWTGGISIIDTIAPPKAEVLERARFLKIPIAILEDIAGSNPQIAKQLLDAVNWGSGHIGRLIPAN